MRTHLIENDIKLFLESSPDVFSSTIKKRIKTWQTAEDGFGRNFLDLLVYQLAIHHEKSDHLWVEIFDKLDSLSFQFQAFHYFPDHELLGHYTDLRNPEIAFHSKQVLMGLIQRGIPFQQADLECFIKVYGNKMDDSLLALFKRLAPIDDVVLFSEVKDTIKHLIDDAYEHAVIDNPSTASRFETAGIQSVLLMLESFGGDSVKNKLNSYLDGQQEKRTFILDYIDSANITQSDAIELLRCFKPCSSVMINLDRLTRSDRNHMLLYFEKVRNNQLIPKQYFTKLQLELMEALQQKFNVKILE
jgi:hypothetical protein